MKNKTIRLSCSHADTCLSGFWSGHHLAHIQVPVTRETTMTELRRALHAELDQGAVAGSEPLSREDSGEEGDRWYKAAHAAIERDVRLQEGKRRPFGDLEPCSDEDAESVYAFFVFQPIED